MEDRTDSSLNSTMSRTVGLITRNTDLRSADGSRCSAVPSNEPYRVLEDAHGREMERVLYDCEMHRSKLAVMLSSRRLHRRLLRTRA